MRQKIGILCCDNTLYIVIQKELRLNFLLYALSLLFFASFAFLLFLTRAQGRTHTHATDLWIKSEPNLKLKREEFRVNSHCRKLIPLGQISRSLIFFLTREKYDGRPWSCRNRLEGRSCQNSRFIRLDGSHGPPSIANDRTRDCRRLSCGVRRGTAVSNAASPLLAFRLLQMKIREKASKHVRIKTARALQVGSIGSAWRYTARMMMMIRRRCQVGSE